VHGLDAIGLLAVQMCTLEGIQQVFTVDPDPARRKLAADLGATHQPAVADRLHRRLAAPDRTPLWHRRRVMDTGSRSRACAAAASHSTTSQPPTGGSTSILRTRSRSPSPTDLATAGQMALNAGSAGV
jgi:threonine dehydrogenase-like Zn-dependent dehydrogenase